MLQIGLHLLALLACVIPLGWYMARVYEGKPCGLDKILKPLEHLIYRLCSIHPNKEMHWTRYLSAMLFLNFLVFLFIYAIQRLQFYLPLNTEHFTALTPDLSFNIATGFTASADFQSYTGESSMSYLNQMMPLSTAKFIAGATGMALLMAFIRGLTRTEASTLGNFWVDLTRSILYILLPLSFLLAIFFVSQGVIQNFKPYQKVELLQPASSSQTEQIIPMGPVASSLAIEQLAVNGGGFFNVNNAHPFENPSPLTNFIEMLATLVIPAALCYTFGIMVGDRRQGLAILAAMLIIYLPSAYVCVTAEQAGNPILSQMGIDPAATLNSYPGGNMEGKESRFGIINSALYAAAATAAASGSNNAMSDSLTPLGGLIPLGLMHTGEVVFGGTGSGLYGMLMLLLVTVFIAGLMVGRKPTYLGKKIETFEIKMASISVLIMPIVVLVLTAISTVIQPGTSAIGNPGTHGFTEILYTFTSLVSTNGGEMSGLNSNTPYYNILGGIAMLLGRYWAAIPTLAIAGSFVRKKHIASNSGTLLTYTPLFIILLTSVSIIIGALTFFPALSLGPIAEHFLLWK